ncbi:MAG: prenyltransferase [Methylomonas sp.]
MLSCARLYKIIATSRPKFLILTPCCLSLAVAYAIDEKIPINYLHLILVFVGALTAHASVNMFNEYGDFVSGLDFHTQRTPFSGGSGTLPAEPELAGPALTAALLSLLLTLLIGLYFIWVRGWGLLPVGFVGILLVYFYTHKITRRPLLCLLAPGLAFGPLMIGGAYYVLSGHYSVRVFAASLIPFFLVNNLLLLNQFPDLEADKAAGRYHLPIMIGRKKSAWVYIFFLVAAYIILLLNIWFSVLPLFSLMALLSLPLAVSAAKKAFKYDGNIENLKPALAQNVFISLTVPVLTAVGIII